MKKDREARDKVIRARTGLLINNGFFGFLAMQLKLIEATPEMGVDTMGVDGFNIFYWPEFVHRISQIECEGVVAHELMHCCFKHFSRRGHRDPQLWNIAGDFAINPELVEADFKLPGTPISLDMIGNPKYVGVRGHLLDPQFKGMNTEAIYDKLSGIIKIIKVYGFDPGGCGGVMEPSEGGSGIDKANQTWETSVRMAVQIAKNQNAGKLPGSLRKLITDLNRPKVSWRDLTRRFIDQSLVKDTTWSRLSRRSVSTGILLPGMISDPMKHLVFFVDISGSISFELCREMVSEVAGALNENTADMISVVYADTAVVHVDHYVQGDIVVAGQYRGGGTDFRDSFDWLKKNAPEASCVIYLTDLEVINYGEDPGCPVLWAVYSPDHRYDQVAAAVPFGSCIHISNI